MVCAVLFVVAYFTFEIGDDSDTFLGLGASTVALGLTLGVALLLIGVGIIQWARKLMGDHEIVEMRHPAVLRTRTATATLAALSLGHRGVRHRPSSADPQHPARLASACWASPPSCCCATSARPAEVADAKAPASNTVWKKGMRVVRDVVGTPIRAADLEIGDLVNAAPEALFATEEDGYPEIEGVELQVAKSKAAVIVVRMEPEEIKPGDGPRELDRRRRSSATPRSAPTSGCPISLYERTTHHLLCPCHQSTFDLADSAQGHLRTGRPPAAAAPAGGGRRGLPGRTERLHRARRAELLGA